MLAAVVFLVACLLPTGCLAGTGWGYDTVDGPDTWGAQYPDCRGSMQSPINIITKDTVYDKNLHFFDTSDYDITDGVQMVLENVGGHTAEVHVKGRQQYIKGGSLPAKFVLNQFHFHWGRNDSRGSEHRIDGKSYPMEMHLVHYQERFNGTAEAASKPFGLHVIGQFIEIGDRNENFQSLIENLHKIPNANDEVEIDTFAVSSLLPQHGFHYYRYDGSLTTPPCYESVTWTVIKNPMRISKEQLNEFRVLYNEDNKPLGDDFRPVQNLNHRTVLTTKRNKNGDDDDD